MTEQKKVVVVCGASSSIGLEITKALLATEYIVVAQVNSNKGALDEIGSHPNFHIIQHDLEKSDQAKNLVEKIIENHLRIDVLINTIGPMLLKNLNEISPQEWQEQIHFNLNLVFYLAHYAKAHLIAAKGQIINFTFSGVEFLKSRIDSTSYCAAKAGLVILTKSLATLLAPYGVRVNAISPGLIEAGRTSQPEREKMAAAIPFGRAGVPSEVAEVLLWLLLKSPNYLTGASIPIAGAWEYI